MRHPTSSALLLALLSVPVSSAIAADGENLLRNADFEKGSKLPAEWERGAPVEGVEYLYDETGGVGGSAALSLRKTIERYFPIAQWVQEIEIRGRPATERLHAGALVRAKEAFKAVIDVQFESAAGDWSHRWAAYIGARRAGDPPADHDWRWYSGVVAIPEGTKKVRLGLQIYGPGQVWFDRALLRFVDDDVPETDAASLEPMDGSRWGELPVPPPGVASVSESGRSVEEIRIGGDPNKRYFLNGPAPGARGPYELLLVVPGGDGSAEFRPFVTRIADFAAPESMIVAQAVAPVWREDEGRIVWPTETNPDPQMEFPSEAFLREIVEDVKSRYKIARGKVFALGWSSGGPPCYALALQNKSPVSGAFIAMSVFKPETLPSLKGARGKAFYLLHSPEDFISMDHPERAKKELEKKKAEVELATYEGGHGWHGDVYGMIREGIRWLERKTK